MRQSLIDANLSSAERRSALKPVAKAALDLSQWAAEGKCDYFLAAQLAMLVRGFARAVKPSPTYPDLEAVLEFLGMSIQLAVGKAHRPEGPPAQNAVAPVEETALTNG